VSLFLYSDTESTPRNGPDGKWSFTAHASTYLTYNPLQLELLRRMAFCIVFYVWYIFSVFLLLPLLLQGLLSVLFARYSVVTPLFAPNICLLFPSSPFFIVLLLLPFPAHSLLRAFIYSILYPLVLVFLIN